MTAAFAGRQVSTRIVVANWTGLFSMQWRRGVSPAREGTTCAHLRTGADGGASEMLTPWRRWYYWNATSAKLRSFLLCS